MRMKQQKRVTKVTAILLALVVIFTLLPSNIVKAANTYTLKCNAGSKKQIIYAKDTMTLYLNVTLLKNGKEVDLKKEKSKVKWTSSNKSVVKIVNTVSESEHDYNLDKDVQRIYAEVSGLKKGKATITASYKDATYKFEITVRGGTIVPGSSDLKDAYVPEGGSIFLLLKGEGWDNLSTKDITFSSSNQSIAKVKESEWGGHTLMGLKEGKTQISVKSKLGILKINVTVLPRYDLELKNFQNVKKNGKIIGYSFDAVNKGSKAVTIIQGVMGDEYGYDRGNVKGGSVNIKKDQTKKVTVIIDGWGEYDFDVAKNGKMRSGYQAGIAVKYEGKVLGAWYSKDGKCVDGEFFMRKW